MIIQLYQKGITTHEIADIIEKMYSCYYLPQTMSNMTQVVAEEVDALHNRSSPSQFAVVYLDVTFITVKRGAAPKEALHVLIGITPSLRNRLSIMAYILVKVLQHTKNY